MDKKMEKLHEYLHQSGFAEGLEYALYNINNPAKIQEQYQFARKRLKELKKVV